jgi:lipopolysaccharide biosynthesis glycosyltransferase
LRNCIFWTVYGDSRYFELAKLSVESFSKFDLKIDLILFTDIIDAKNYFPSDVIIKHENFLGGLSSKMSKRFEIAASLLETYDRVLHVDTDVIAYQSYEEIFTIDSTKISFASECPPLEFRQTCFDVGNPNDRAVGKFWAGPLLSLEEITKYEHVPSICVGVWLANRSHTSWLRQIHKEVIDYEQAGFMGPCADQHAVVKNLITNERWDLQLQRFVTHSGQKLKNDKDYQRLSDSTNIIVHFAGGVQPTDQKMNMMRETLLRSRK